MTDLTRLIENLPDGVVITDPGRMASYRWDRANDPQAGMPLAVVLATSTADVQAAVRFAAAHDIAVIPRGAGSGLSGGSSAIDGCMVVSLERMKRVTVDPVTRTVVAQPGAFNADVKAAAAAHGLWYPPDPSSFEFCSIGGNVATNAGGLCCVKYGVTSDYVLGLRVVLADATVVELGGARLKDVAGLPLTKLFVGSEGTLGIITSITLKLIQAQRAPSTLVASFASLDDATQAVLDITGTMRPSMLEFMDRTSINAIEDMTRMGLNRADEGLLILQSDEPAASAAEQIVQIAGLCEQNHATEVFSTDDPEAGDAFVLARRIAVPAMEQKGSLLLDDVGVPLPELGALVRGIESIATARGVTIAVIAHAGDGNAHPLIVFDAMDSDESARAQSAYGEIMDLAIALGGTITGEHGVGRLKKRWLPDYLGPEVLDLNHRIKLALDPQNILNPGAVLDKAVT